VPIVLKSGSLNLLEPSGPVKACNGIAFLNEECGDGDVGTKGKEDRLREKESSSVKISQCLLSCNPYYSRFNP
jgi:hypothetical protein